MPRFQQGMILMIALIFLLLSSLMLSALLWQSQLGLAASAAGQQQFMLMSEALTWHRLALRKQQLSSEPVQWQLLLSCPVAEPLLQDAACQVAQLLTEVDNDDGQYSAYRTILWRRQADQPWLPLITLTDEQEW